MRRRIVPVIGTLAVALILAQRGTLAECINVGPGPAEPPKPPPPIVVAGAICGTTSIDGSKPTDLAGISLSLFDEHDVLVATTQLDSNARFEFSDLPSGRYRLQPESGFAHTDETIEVAQGGQLACDRPLFVKLNIGVECATASRISTTRPQGF